ncbi:OsmC family protein [Halomonas sp. TRM85114]|uniref:OsmC family protein n=1 Tax=Halomonas jincaotanensis TaxID=2810616 RepID=UPI001BD319B6|nr:OsmC family protein [Halomonas jincaotanensis]MBS9403946.1 OsmC family protein [Halomonas jincaotanensis]
MEMLSEPVVTHRQRALQQTYRRTPEAAWISDHARALDGDPADPIRGEIEPANNGGVRWAYGLHRAVGGDHDAPNPGDLLTSALAACLRSTTRMVAQRLRIGLADVEVHVAAEVDVRGALRVDPSVPVGFQRLHCDVSAQVTSGTSDAATLKVLANHAEACCIVMQTLKHGVEIQTEWRISQQ